MRSKDAFIVKGQKNAAEPHQEPMGELQAGIGPQLSQGPKTYHLKPFKPSWATDSAVLAALVQA